MYDFPTTMESRSKGECIPSLDKLIGWQVSKDFFRDDNNEVLHMTEAIAALMFKGASVVCLP